MQLKKHASTPKSMAQQHTSLPKFKTSDMIITEIEENKENIIGANIINNVNRTERAST